VRHVSLELGVSIDWRFVARIGDLTMLRCTEEMDDGVLHACDERFDEFCYTYTHGGGWAVSACSGGVETYGRPTELRMDEVLCTVSV
jgi:hypothetical protein